MMMIVLASVSFPCLSSSCVSELQNSGVPQEGRYVNHFDLLVKREQRSACPNKQEILFGQTPFESFNGSSNTALDFSLLIDFWMHSLPPFICFLYQLQMSPPYAKVSQSPLCS